MSLLSGGHSILKPHKKHLKEEIIDCESEEEGEVEDTMSDEENSYNVEKIVNHVRRKGLDAETIALRDMRLDMDLISKSIMPYAFKVRWEGFGPEDDTWEPIENFTDKSFPLVERYCLRHGISIPPEAKTIVIETSSAYEESSEDESVRKKKKTNKSGLLTDVFNSEAPKKLKKKKRDMDGRQQERANKARNVSPAASSESPKPPMKTKKEYRTADDDSAVVEETEEERRVRKEAKRQKKRERKERELKEQERLERERQDQERILAMQQRHLQQKNKTLQQHSETPKSTQRSSPPAAKLKDATPEIIEVSPPLPAGPKKVSLEEYRRKKALKEGRAPAGGSPPDPPSTAKETELDPIVLPPPPAPPRIPSSYVPPYPLLGRTEPSPSVLRRPSPKDPNTPKASRRIVWHDDVKDNERKGKEKAYGMQSGEERMDRKIREEYEQAHLEDKERRLEENRKRAAMIKEAVARLNNPDLDKTVRMDASKPAVPIDVDFEAQAGGFGPDLVDDIISGIRATTFGNPPANKAAVQSSVKDKSSPVASKQDIKRPSPPSLVSTNGPKKIDGTAPKKPKWMPKAPMPAFSFFPEPSPKTKELKVPPVSAEKKAKDREREEAKKRRSDEMEKEKERMEKEAMEMELQKKKERKKERQRERERRASENAVVKEKRKLSSVSPPQPAKKQKIEEDVKEIMAKIRDGSSEDEEEKKEPAPVRRIRSKLSEEERRSIRERREAVALRLDARQLQIARSREVLSRRWLHSRRERHQVSDEDMQVEESVYDNPPCEIGKNTLRRCLSAEILPISIEVAERYGDMHKLPSDGAKLIQALDLSDDKYGEWVREAKLARAVIAAARQQALDERGPRDVSVLVETFINDSVIAMRRINPAMGVERVRELSTEMCTAFLELKSDSFVNILHSIPKEVLMDALERLMNIMSPVLDLFSSIDKTKRCCDPGHGRCRMLLTILVALEEGGKVEKWVGGRAMYKAIALAAPCQLRVLMRLGGALDSYRHPRNGYNAVQRALLTASEYTIFQLLRRGLDVNSHIFVDQNVNLKKKLISDPTSIYREKRDSMWKFARSHAIRLAGRSLQWINALNDGLSIFTPLSPVHTINPHSIEIAVQTAFMLPSEPIPGTVLVVAVHLVRITPSGHVPFTPFSDCKSVELAPEHVPYISVQKVPTDDLKDDDGHFHFRGVTIMTRTDDGKYPEIETEYITGDSTTSIFRIDPASTHSLLTEQQLMQLEVDVESVPEDSVIMLQVLAANKAIG